MRHDFVSNAGCRRPVKRIPQVIKLLRNQCLALSRARLAESLPGDTHVPGIEKNDTDKVLIRARMRGSREATHAVTTQSDSACVYSILRRHIRLPYKRNRGIRVFNNMSDGNVPRTAP